MLLRSQGSGWVKLYMGQENRIYRYNAGMGPNYIQSQDGKTDRGQRFSLGGFSYTGARMCPIVLAGLE